MADSQPAGESRPAHSPDDALPPVQPPSGTFILQLFFIPLFIVALIVCVWLAFSWLAHVGNDPKDLVNDLKRLNDSSWQKALNLANLLRNAEYDKVKDDPKLAQEIANLLEAEIQAGKFDESRLRLRIFLCRALGEFRVTTGLPVLIRAATEERDPGEISVRGAAVEAIAVMADKLRSEDFRNNHELVAAVDGAATSRSDVAEEKHVREELRSRAAFTLGVIGGEAATDRLVKMLADSYANVRYNAATGLARQGELRAKAGLLEMLDPENKHVVEDEKSPSEQNLKRQRVQAAALDAADQLRKKVTDPTHPDWQEIAAAVTRLSTEGSHGRIKSQAKELVIKWAPTTAPAATNSDRND